MGCCASSFDVQTKEAAGAGALHGKNAEAAREAADAAALLTGTHLYSSWVELQLCCSKLKSADVLTKSDPMAIVYERVQNGFWREVGRTEVISNTHEPSFVERIRVMFNFERVQELRVVVVDLDKQHEARTARPEQCNPLGQAEVRLADVVAARGTKFSAPLVLRGNKTTSTVTIGAEEVSAAREVFTMQLSSSGLPNVDLFSKSDPFLIIARGQEDGSWLPVYKTEVVQDNLNPVWKPFTLTAIQLCNGDYERPLRFQVFDYDALGSHKLLGELQCSVKALQAQAQKGSSSSSSGGSGGLVLTSNVRSARASGRAALLHVQSLGVQVRPTFLDYVRAGAELNFMVAVDFTASNGHPSRPESLHHIPPHGGFTAYEQAIMGVGQVLEAYDSDKVIQCVGFGGVRGRVSSGPASHCFSLGPREDGLYVGVEGVLSAYRQSLSEWTLSGPTHFTPVVRHALSAASQPHPHLSYMVLLILTDGAIMDMQATIDAIVDASSAPMSLLIVGVGDSPELVKMEVLDSDGVVLHSSVGRPARRDITQFVHFNKFRNDGEALAAELLAELPAQFLQYVREHNIPLPSGPPVHAVGVPMTQAVVMADPVAGPAPRQEDEGLEDRRWVGNEEVEIRVPLTSSS